MERIIINSVFWQIYSNFKGMDQHFQKHLQMTAGKRKCPIPPAGRRRRTLQ
jgi:hypothetical protein